MDMSTAVGRSGHVRNVLHIVLLFVCLFIHAFWEMEGVRVVCWGGWQGWAQTGLI